MARGLCRAVKAAYDTALTDGAKTLGRELMDSLTKKFTQIEQKNILCQTSLLDPRFKGKVFAIQDTRDHAKRVVKQEAEQLLNRDQPVVTEEQTQDTGDEDDNHDLIWGDFDRSVQDATSATPLSKVTTELNQFLLEPVVKRKEDPLAYWKARELLYPTLAKMARKYFSVMATSVPSERIFSKTGQLVSERRSRLKPKAQSM